MALTSEDILYIACEMEKRAISLYRRAELLISDEAVLEQIRAIRADEQNHFALFSGKRASLLPPLRAALLSSIAAARFHPGALSGMARGHAFSSVQALLLFAMGEERRAIDAYGHMHKSARDASVRELLKQVISEEEQHLAALDNTLSTIE